MYIKIENVDKRELHHAKSYFSNKCGGGLDLNIKRIDDVVIQRRIEQGDDINIYVMNNDGKTIDRI